MKSNSQTRSRTVERSDAPDIHVVEAGPSDARPLLFVHGISQCHLSWREQLCAPLSSDFRTVAMDLRGHGDSETPDAGYDDGAAWAGDVHAVVEALGLDSVVLVGWSYGSLVALDYLAAHGADRVAGANLVGVVCGIGTDRTDRWLQPGYLDLFPDLLATDAEESVAALERFVEQCVAGDLTAEQRYLMLGYNAAVPPRVRERMLDRSVSHLDFLAEFPVPLRLTHGERDGVIGIEAARAAHERVPDGDLSVYPESGHSPFFENPERYNEELREFVDGL
jgi:pimeloyl-ACP methyl ester carboxylesterase